MKHKIILIFLILAAFHGCAYDMDFDGFDRKPRLLVVGMAGGSGETVIRLLPTAAVGDYSSSLFSVSEAQVSLKVNGEDVPVSASGNSDRLSDCFYADRTFLPGDRLEFRASVPGVEPVRAQTVVPEGFPGYEVNLAIEENVWTGKNDNGISDRLKVTVTFEDDPDKDEYYGMQVYRMEEIKSYFNVYEYDYMNPVTHVASGVNDYPLKDLPIVMHYAPGTDLFSQEYAPMLIVDDGTFEGGNGQMEFLTTYINDHTGRTYYYKIFLYRLSPELYRFAKASAINSDHVPILLMVAPPVNCYTNIIGGVGIFGALACTETDWLPNVN